MAPTVKDLVPPTGAFDAAVFDFDGTIAASAHVWRLVDETFLSRRNIPYEPGISAQLAARGFAEGARWIVGEFGLPDDPEAVCDEWNELGGELYRDQVYLRPGAEAYIRSLREAGVPCALATNNDPAVIAALGPRMDMDGLFDVQVYGCEVGRDKRHPDIYLETARRLGVDPARCAVFEDIPDAVASAKEAGALVVGVRSDDPNQDAAAVAAAADLFLEDWKELL